MDLCSILDRNYMLTLTAFKSKDFLDHFRAIFFYRCFEILIDPGPRHNTRTIARANLMLVIIY